MSVINSGIIVVVVVGGCSKEEERKKREKGKIRRHRSIEKEHPTFRRLSSRYDAH